MTATLNSVKLDKGVYDFDGQLDLSNGALTGVSPHIIKDCTSNGMYAVITAPKYAGSLFISENVCLWFKNKPNKFHLFMMKLCFGFTWKDSND